MKNDVDEPALKRRVQKSTSNGFVLFPALKIAGGRCAAVAEVAQRRPGNRKSGGAGFSLGGVEKFFLILVEGAPRPKGRVNKA